MKEDIFSYQDKIDEIINRLDWVMKPIFIQEMGTEEWLEIEIHNPILITLSNFISEDFGVSAAQALSKGWNCILSDWGGHKDVPNSASIKVPNQYLYDNSGFTHLLEARTKLAAEFIHSQLANSQVKNETQIKEPAIQKNYLELSTIDRLRREFIINNGGATSLYLLRGQMNKFKAQECGEKFFTELTKILSQQELVKPNTIVITDDLSGTIPGTKDIYLNILKNQIAEKKEVEFIQLNKAMWKTNLLKVREANEIIIGFWTPKLTSYIKLIRELKKRDCIIKISSCEKIDELSSFSDIERLEL